MKGILIPFFALFDFGHDFLRQRGRDAEGADEFFNGGIVSAFPRSFFQTGDERILLEKGLLQDVFVFDVVGFLLLFDDEIRQREFHVLIDRHVRIKGVVLEHETDASFFRIQVSHVVFVEIDETRRGILETGNHVKRGAFAASGRAKKPHQFSIFDDEIQVRYGFRGLPILIS